MLTADFGKEGELERYDAFMHELVELIVDKYDGSLKAEHGTGINMAPFVEREWGAAATEMMWRVKRLADPAGVLAPGWCSTAIRACTCATSRACPRSRRASPSASSAASARRCARRRT